MIRVGATPKVAQVARVPQMPAANARAFQRSISDDERTMVMPQKPKSNPPGFIASPTPSTSLAPSLKTAAPAAAARDAKADRPRPPMSMANDEHTILRPNDLPKGAFAAGRPSPMTAPSPAPSATKAATPAVNAPGNAKANGPDSGGLIDVPATVITTRTRVLVGRPTVSWAAALMAMGVFVGLVSAVVARGDTDALIDATASFVDPSHTAAKVSAAAQPAAAPVVAQMMPAAAAPVAAPAAPPATPVAMSTPAPSATTCAADAPKADAAKSSDAKLEARLEKLEKSDKSDAKHAEQAKTVEAKVEPKVAPTVRRWTVPSHEVKVAAAKPAPKAEKVAAAEKPEKTEKKPAKVESESESATAADALARAQLEASLK